MGTDGIKLRIALLWSLSSLAAVGPARGQNAPPPFAARLLPADSMPAAPSVAAQSPRLRFDPRLLPAFSVLAAQADTAPTPPMRFNVRPVSAGAALAGTVVVAMVPSIFGSHLPHATCAPCIRAHLLGIDRGTVGPQLYSAATVSDAFVYTSLVSAGVAVLTESDGIARDHREDFVVFAQAVATADLVTAWAKVLFHRPRPFRYLPSAAGMGDDVKSGLSFPSGHSTAAWAAAFAYWSIQRRHGRARERAPIIAALITSALMTGVMRVEAHQHFPTDVMAGAVIGATIGWVVPRLYPVRR